MDNYSQKISENGKSRSQDTGSSGVTNENIELFKRALSDAAYAKERAIEEAIKNVEVPTPSKRHKILMNRLFRECVGGAFLPFPEEDNIYDRV